MSLHGYTQADQRFYLGSEPSAALDAFILRRARLVLEATVARYFDFRLMPDFGEGKAQLMDGYLDLRFRPWVGLRVGKFKPPLGLERLQSAADLRFVERGAPTNLVPNRDVGVVVQGQFRNGAVAYTGGVMDGAPDLVNGDGDRTDDKDFVGRVFFQPFVTRGPAALRGLGVGIAGSTGKETGSVSSPALPAYKTPGQVSFFAYRSDGTAAGTAFADGWRRRIAPQGYFYSGPLGLMGEYTISRQLVRLGANTDMLEHRAWQVAGSWLLTGEKASYRSITPAHAFNPDSSGWGAVELAARYGEVLADQDAFPVFANPATSMRSAKSWGVGITWYLARQTKVVVNYERTTFNALGATARTPEQFLVSRVQVGF